MLYIVENRRVSVIVIINKGCFIYDYLWKGRNKNVRKINE